MRTYSYGAKAPTVNGAEVERQFRAAHAYYNRVIDVLREEIVARCRAESPEAKALAHEKALADMRDIYAKSGTFWGTTIATAEAAQTAAKGLRRFVTDRPGRCGSCRSEFQAGIEIEWAPGRGIVACPACPNGGYGLRYRRKGKGDLLAVQIQKGMPAAEILAGTDSRVRIVGTGGRRMLWFRIGSNGREPIWAQFPIRFHRDFPADAVVKWVRITRRRIASRQVWAAQFILDTELAILPRPTLGTIALDIGWRRVPHGLRVCVWVSDTGETGELVIPERLLGRDRKVSDLKSIRDKHFNLAKEIVHAHGKDPFTTLGEMATNVANWRSQGRLAATLIQHRSTAQLFRTLEAWRQKDKHLWEWEAHQRDNTIQSRRQMYRLFALFVAKFRNVVVEKMDLRKLTKLPEPEERLPRAATASTPLRVNSSPAAPTPSVAPAVPGGRRIRWTPRPSVPTAGPRKTSTTPRSSSTPARSAGAAGTRMSTRRETSSGVPPRTRRCPRVRRACASVPRGRRPRRNCAASAPSSGAAPRKPRRWNRSRYAFGEAWFPRRYMRCLRGGLVSSTGRAVL
jgi:hypothetical protein